MRLLVICLFLLPLCFQHAKAETTVPGSNCHSITPSQASLMEWREQGLKNSSSTDYWINCPFERPASRSELELTVRAVNQTEDDLDLSCNFREFFAGKQQPGGKSATAEIAGGAHESLTVTLQPNEYDSVMNATCKLSKGIAIEATKVGFSQTCSGESVEGFWTGVLAYGFDGAELGVIAFTKAGEIAGQGSNGAVTRDIEGTFEINPNSCMVNATLSIDGSTVRATGYLSEGHQTMQTVAVNSVDYYTAFTLVRAGGALSRSKVLAGSMGETDLIHLPEQISPPQ